MDLQSFQKKRRETPLENQSSNRGQQDRLSDLPDSLIHHIFSFLDSRDVVQSSILSNRWKALWLSTPNLDFDLDYWLKKCRDFPSWSEKFDSFINFVHNVLIRRGDSRIFKFRLYTYDHDFDDVLPIVSSWMVKALECNVQHLILRFPLGLEGGTRWLGLELPDSLFTSTIKALEIAFCPDPLVPLPNISAASGIKDLVLSGVKLPDGNVNGELLLSCSVLETLTINHCDVRHLKVMTISAPILETLWLRLSTKRKNPLNSWRRTPPPHEDKVHVKINTPKISSLMLSSWSCENLSGVDYSIEEDLLSLVSATVYIGTKVVELMEDCSRGLMKILPRVRNARRLTLAFSSKLVLTEFPILAKELPYGFLNVRHIMLIDSIQTPCLRAISNFLETFPSLETMVWERPWTLRYNHRQQPITDEAEELVPDLPFQSTFTCLKTAEFRNVKGVEFELKFLAFIFETAICLKKVIIKYDTRVSGDKLAELEEKIFSLPRTSSNALVSLQYMTPDDYTC
ncbi:hypothetical protein ACHQM5_028235 [Ranunculus cassubicifolius]